MCLYVKIKYTIIRLKTYVQIKRFLLVEHNIPSTISKMWARKAYLWYRNWFYCGLKKNNHTESKRKLRSLYIYSLSLSVMSNYLWPHGLYVAQPGSFVHGIFQGRILGWVAISFSRGSSQHRDWNQVSCIAGRFFIVWVTREAQFFK